jgi:endonuclease/exonuclease/phosphatase family metal-dependent hydrolase
MPVGLQAPLHAGATVYGTLVRPLRPFLDEWACCRSEADLRRRSTYRQSHDAIQQVLSAIDVGDHSCDPPAKRPAYRILAWNLQRGIQLEGQVGALRTHPYLSTCDVLLISEADVGMARSQNRSVAETLARELHMRYAFVPSYLNLTKGSGLERQSAGDNEVGVEGNAILSRYPISDVRRVALPKRADTVAGVDKRIGTEAAVAATIEFPGLRLAAVAVHLSARSSRQQRRAQMREVLAQTAGSERAIVGGDWNTTTTDTSGGYRASLVAFRATMGIDRLIRRHYLRPDSGFEKGLFALLERHGFDYRSCNALGEPTVFYRVDDERASGALRDWVPGWCFAWIRWGLRNHGGCCPLRLDWFAARGLSCRDPVVIHDLPAHRGVRLSDHDPIGVDVLARA